MTMTTTFRILELERELGQEPAAVVVPVVKLKVAQAARLKAEPEDKLKAEPEDKLKVAVVVVLPVAPDQRAQAAKVSQQIAAPPPTKAAAQTR